MIYVASHERSGTHLCLNLIQKNAVKPLALSSVREFDPHHQHAPGLVKTHADRPWFDHSHHLAPSVYVLRDPRASMWSWFHYLNHPEFHRNNPAASAKLFEGGDVPSDLEAFLTRPVGPFLRYSYSLEGGFQTVVERWAKHVQGWLEAADALVVTYREMVEHPAEVMGRIALMTGLKTRCTCAGVSLHEMPTVLPRKGTVDDWRNGFTTRTEQIIFDAIDRLSLRPALQAHLRL